MRSPPFDPQLAKAKIKHTQIDTLTQARLLRRNLSTQSAGNTKAVYEL